MHGFVFMEATRPRGIFPPATATPASVRVINPPSIPGFRFNHHKANYTDAFRPTAPGLSPGAGHDQPPNAP
ncbi:hypothetical protein Ancab_033124 [Ancistrocladus abbreviatus]